MSKGLTLLELMISVVLLSVLGLFLLARVLNYQEMAEKTTVDLTVMNLRTGLRYQVAEYLAQNRDNDIIALAGKNPVHWLKTPPPNYLGERKNQPWQDIPPGNWYFDLDARQLCYRVNNDQHFVPGKSGHHGLCLQIQATNRGSATLILVEPYQWL